MSESTEGLYSFGSLTLESEENGKKENDREGKAKEGIIQCFCSLTL
jgi:hypothetical protein